MEAVYPLREDYDYPRHPGEGKTTLALRVVSACSTGTALPGMEACAPFDVIYQTAEDGLGSIDLRGGKKRSSRREITQRAKRESHRSR